MEKYSGGLIKSWRLNVEDNENENVLCLIIEETFFLRFMIQKPRWVLGIREKFSLSGIKHV